MKKTLLDKAKINKNNNYSTPYEAIYPLIKYLPKKNLNIWECCDSGNSKITEILVQNGYMVTSTDIKRGFNFLTDIPYFDFDLIITNPPFDLKKKFIEKCYSYNKPFALLLPTYTLESKLCYSLFEEYGISTIILSDRINYIEGTRAWFNSSWFIWNVTLNNKLIFEKVSNNINVINNMKVK